MIAIDTNVLLRVFVRDNPRQTEAAVRLIEAQPPDSVYLASIVLAEFVWTLNRRYRVDKPTIVDTIKQVLERAEFRIEAREAAIAALEWFESGAADFGDFLIAAIGQAAGAAPTHTFDQDAGLNEAFSLIEA